MVIFGLAMMGGAIDARPAADSPPAAPADAPAPLRLSVDEAVRLALRENPTLKSAQAEALAAQTSARAARAETRPRVSATTYASTSTMSSVLTTPPGVGGPTNAYVALPAQHLDQDLMLMIPLLTGGRLSAGIRSAQAEGSAAARDAEGTALDIALTVKEAYRRALYTRATVSVSDERVKEETERVRVAQERFDVGRGAKVELLRAQAELADAQQGQTDAVRDGDLALIDLRVSIGVSAETPLELTDSLTLSGEPVEPDERLSLAVQNRPELRGANLRVQAAEAELTRTRAAYRPQVYGVAMADINATRRMGMSGGTTLGITVGWPLADGGSRRAEVEAAQARLDQARSNEQALWIRVQAEVKRASLELAAAAANITRSQAAVIAGEEEYRLAQLRYEAGRSVLVEVLDAFTALTRARTNHLKALYEYNVALDRLSRAMGISTLPGSSGAPATQKSSHGRSYPPLQKKTK
jgi:outer membrane protein TolC